MLWGLDQFIPGVRKSPSSATKLFFAAQDMTQLYCTYVADPREPGNRYYAWGVPGNTAAVGTAQNDTETLATGAVLAQYRCSGSQRWSRFHSRLGGTWAIPSSRFLQYHLFHRYYDVVYGGKLPWTAATPVVRGCLLFRDDGDGALSGDRRD